MVCGSAPTWLDAAQHLLDLVRVVGADLDDQVAGEAGIRGASQNQYCSSHDPPMI